MFDDIVHLDFDNMPTLFENRKQFFKYFRKKTIIDGKTYILKVENDKSMRQVRCDAIKHLFDLRPMNSWAFFDITHNQLGVAIEIIYKEKKPLTYAEEKVWFIEENLKDLLKIAVFDGFIGNTDRHSSNILVLEDNSLLAIDEAESEKVPKNSWVRHKREKRMLIYKFYLENKEWFYEWCDSTKKKLSENLEITLNSLKPKEVNNTQFYMNNLERWDSIVIDSINQLIIKSAFKK